MKRIDVFSGYSISNRLHSRGCFTLTFQNERNHIFQLPAVEISLENGRTMTIHYILVYALLDALNNLSNSKPPKEPLLVTYYCANRKIAFEWNQEYLQDHAFSGYTEDLDLWNEISEVCADCRMELRIAETDSVLNGIVRIESGRVQHL